MYRFSAHSLNKCTQSLRIKDKVRLKDRIKNADTGENGCNL